MIYFNGDSHTHGADVSVDQRFSNIVTKHFGQSLINDAKLGASNAKILRTTKQYLENNHPDLVVIGWTTWEREEWEFQGHYYDVNGSGHDALPTALELQYKEWVTTQNADSLKIKSDYWHNQIYNFHTELIERRQPHLFFNCMYNFFNADVRDWHNCHVGPYDTNDSYYWYLRRLGYRADKWFHYDADGHQAWADLLIDRIKL